MIVHAEHLSFRYRVKPSRRGKRQDLPSVATALNDVSFAVPDAGLVALLGPNGSGKSTLFRILATMLAPGAGEARIFGHHTVREASRVRAQIGVVFQESSLDRKLTVLENLRFQGNLYGLRCTALDARIEHLAAQFGLADRLNDLAETLSGGLRRRVEIARGLLHQPRLLLLDEPSTGLDPAARRELWRYLADIHDKEGIAVLAATHYLEEADVCHRVLIFDRGQLVADGLPAAMKREVEGDVVLVESDDPATLLDWMERLPGVRAATVDGAVRAECPDGPALIAALMQQHAGAIHQVQLHKPSLEDVYYRATGRTFQE